MKNNSPVFGASFRTIAALAFVCSLGSLHAQYDSPIFGENLEMGAVVYEWQQAGTDGNGNRIDFYGHREEVNGIEELSEASVVSNPNNPNLATVTGVLPGEGGALEGYIRVSNGIVSFRNYESSTNPGTPMKVNGATYLLDQETTVGLVDLGPESLVEYVSRRRYTAASGSQFVIDFDGMGGGSVTGSVTGYVFEGLEYINGRQRNMTANNIQRQVNNGTETTTYKLVEITECHSFDEGNGAIVSWNTSESWVATTDPQRVVTVTNNEFDVPGIISGAESGAVLGGGWMIDMEKLLENIPLGQQYAVTYFGVTLMSKKRSYLSRNTISYDNRVRSEWSEWIYFEGANSAQATVSSYNVSETPAGYESASTSVSGWTRQIGTFGGSEFYDSVSNNPFTWAERGDSLYAPRNLLVDGVLYTLSSSQSDGTYIRDIYSGPSEEELWIGGSDSSSEGPNPYQHFVGREPLHVSLGGLMGQCYPGASGAAREGMLVVGNHVIVPATDAPRSTPYFLEAGSIWMDSQEYAFESGYDDSEGNHADVYGNVGGKISLFGRAMGNADLVLNGSFAAGGLQNGTFAVPGVDLYVSPPAVPVFPDALWFDGMIGHYNADASSTNLASYYFNGNLLTRIYLTSVNVNEQTYSVTGDETLPRPDDPGSPEIDESVDEFGAPAYQVVNLVGPVAMKHGKGVFMLERPDGLKRLAIGVSMSDDSPIFSETFSFIVPPASSQIGLPPGLSLSQATGEARRIWQYLGTADLGGGEAAWYGSDRRPDEWQPLGTMVKVGIPSKDEQGEVPAQAVQVKMGDLEGTFLTESRLFQIPRDTGMALPMPVFAVETSMDDTLWNPLLPAGGLPASFRSADGRLWRFAGEDNSEAVYLGQHAGQQLVLDPPGPDGYRLAHLTDSETGLNTQGTFNVGRQSILMRDGSLVYVNSANAWGLQNPTDLPENQLHGIAGDLDITGNMVTFGSLLDDASRAGAIFRFEDRPPPEGEEGMANVVALHSILSRPQAEWSWQRAAEGDPEVGQRVMLLDQDHRLGIYSRSGDSLPSILLNPAGPSFIKGGPLRVFPAGDVPMAQDFRQGPVPGQ